MEQVVRVRTQETYMCGLRARMYYTGQDKVCERTQDTQKRLQSQMLLVYRYLVYVLRISGFRPDFFYCK